MKIFAKLVGAFAAVALICAIVGGIGWYGIHHTETGLVEVAEVRLPSIQGLGLLKEAMNAIKSAERTMLISSISYKDRQHEINNLQKRWALAEKGWDIYEPLPQTAEETALWKQFEPAWNQWRAEHQKLVELVGQVKLDDVESLEGTLVTQKLAHIQWANGLAAAINNGSPFTGQLNPSLCGLGKWMSNYETDDPDFRALLGHFMTPHEKLHGLGEKVNTLLSQGQPAKAQTIFTKEVKPTLTAIEGVFDRALGHVRADLALLDAAVAIGFGSERKAFSKTMKLLEEISELNVSLSEATTIAVEADAQRSQTISLSTVFFGVLVALAFGFFMARSISRPMAQTAYMIEELEKGHLGTRLQMDRQDEIGQMATAMDAFADSLEHEVVGSLQKLASGDLTFTVVPKDNQDMIRGALQKLGQDLNALIAKLYTSGEQIASGSTQVADGSQSLSQGATESAASVEEITASMTELASQTKQNAENADQANLLVNQAKAAADKGNQQMQNMVGAMAEINEAGQNISKIIKVIDEIAFQTNLLALNAAVEAARAGQHGKGFAVVAEEVRNLAARSAQAAKETAELIEGSVQKTQNGSQIAGQTEEALKEIVVAVIKATDLVSEIAAASNEQSQGIGQINQGLGQIDQVTQQNTANAEESAAAAEELSSQAEQLRQMLARFKLSEQAGANRSSSAQIAPSVQNQSAETTPRANDMNSPIPPSIALDDSEFGKY